MSILTEGFPQTVCIDGKDYAVNTDFRIWIRFSEILEDPAMSAPEKAQKILLLCYPETLPPSFLQAIEGLLWFYGCGKENKKGHKNKTNQRKKPVFDFAADAALIYSAFWQEYGIDLANAGLHWWQFWSLFSGLGENTRLMKVIGYRSAELSQIADKNQKRFYREMKALYRLPDRRSNAQREEDFTQQLALLFEEG